MKCHKFHTLWLFQYSTAYTSHHGHKLLAVPQVQTNYGRQYFKKLAICYGIIYPHRYSYSAESTAQIRRSFHDLNIKSY